MMLELRSASVYVYLFYLVVMLSLAISPIMVELPLLPKIGLGLLLGSIIFLLVRPYKKYFLNIRMVHITLSLAEVLWGLFIIVAAATVGFYAGA